MTYLLCDTVSDYHQGLKLLEDSPRLAADSETYCLPEWKARGGSALDPHTGGISLLQLMGDTTVPVILDILLLTRQGFDARPLINLLQSRDYLVGANFKFDLKFIKKQFGVMLENGHCVVQLAKLLSNATGSKVGKTHGHSLKALARDLLNVAMEGKGEEQVTDWYARPEDEAGRAYWHQKLSYGAGDVRYLFPIHDMLWSVLTAPLPYSDILYEGATEPPYGLGMAKTVDLEMKMIHVSAEMEYNGLPASREVLTQLQDLIWDKRMDSGRLLEVAGELCDDFGLETYETPWVDYRIPTKKSLQSLNSPEQLRLLIQQAMGLRKLDSVQAELLDRLIDLLDQQGKEGVVDFVDEDEADTFREILELDSCSALQNCAIARRVSEYKRLFKLYGMDLRKYINPVTGCIHSGLDPLGSATGRSSSSRPNMQQVSGRTTLVGERDENNLFPSSAVYEELAVYRYPVAVDERI